MSDPSPIPTPVENFEIEPKISYQNAHTIDSIEQKLNRASADRFPPRALIIKRKAKQKDDGPLEVICGFIVEHQIGMMTPPCHPSQILADYKCRIGCQSPHAPRLDTYVFPSSSKTYPQIFRTFILQPRVWRISGGMERYLDGVLLGCCFHWSSGIGHGLYLDAAGEERWC